MFYLAVCNSTQGNGVFLGGSQQHSRKVAYFLEASGTTKDTPSGTAKNTCFLGSRILALKEILDPQRISTLV